MSGEKISKTDRLSRNVTITLFVIGLLFVAFSLGAEFLGLDITPGFGMVQMFQLLLGITALTVAIFMHINALRQETARSLQADIGVRLAATGLVFAYVTGLSDLIRIGTHVQPQFERPFVGPLQLGGLALAVLVIVVGLALYYTSRGTRQKSSMEFIVNGNGNHS
ncbi:MAG: hypothetical protein H6654_00640 [Ardenticatenaceae bacterium]|nr:hypothetical protein [Anaerolineales bacterium]MCB8940696.1 hypothetical protein [Ardenticatenaceae bacterium]MCB8972035.1 hypothetical protein [Ardenticatenaceae bacterium]